MADDKILLEIEFDDGQIKKAFAKVKREAENFNKGLESDAKSTGENIGTNLSTNIITSFRAISVSATAAFATISAGAAALGAVLAGAVKLATLDEEENRINATFDNLAKNAGISANNIRASFTSVADGLADTEDLLLSASTALLNLGNSSERLPQLLEAARQVTLRFGGDLNETFQNLVKGVNTANERALRSSNIFIDAGKAQERYAQSVGKSVQNLTDQEKSIATLNAVLEFSNKNFDDNAKSVQPLTENLTRLRNAVNTLIETIASIVNSRFGSFLADAAESATKLVQELARLGGATFGPVIQQANQVKFDLDEVNERLAELRTRFDRVGTAGFIGITAEIQRLEAESTRLTNKLNELNQVIANSRKPLGPDLTNTEVDLSIDQRIKQLQLLQSVQQQTITTEAQRIASLQALGETEINNSALVLAELTKQKTDYELQLLTLQNQFQTEKLISQTQYNDLVKQLAQNNQLAVENIFAKGNKAIKDDTTKTFEAIRTAINNAANRIVTEGLATIGASLVKGGSAFKDFGKNVLGILGDFAIQVGQLLLGIGFGLDRLKEGLASFNGAAVAAAGAALIVLGGALKALSGGTGQTNSISASAAVSTSPVGVAEPAPTVDVERQRETQQAININIQGDLLDADSTGLRIAEILNSVIDSRGVTIRTGVTA